MKYCIIFLLLGTGLLNAQEYQHTISAGYGTPNLPKLLLKKFNSYQDKVNFSSSGYGPLHLKYEYRKHPRIGFVASINHVSYSIRFTERYADTFGRWLPNNIRIRQNRTALNARVNYHILNPENYEKSAFYVGMGMGYNFGKSPEIEADYQDGVARLLSIPPLMLRFSFETSLGYRYQINETFGVYGELGWAKSLLQAGFTVQF